MSFGDIRLGETHDLKFGTSVNGVPTALVGGAIAAYVDNGTSEITAGLTLSADFDGVVGLNNVRIVATGGNGHAAGTNIDLVLTAGTVGGDSVVGRPIGSLSIAHRSALMPTTAGMMLDVSAGGEAGLDWANIGSPTTAQNLSGTNIDVDQVVASVSGAVGSIAAGGINAAAIATGAIDADALATDAVNEIVDQVWEEAIAAHSGTSGSTAEALAAAAAGGSPGAIADAVWDEARAGHVGAGSFGEGVIVETNNDKTSYALTAAYNAAKTAAQAGDAMTLTVGERNAIAAALLDLANGIETGVTLRQAQRLELAALAGKLSGAATTTVTFRNAVADSKNRIVATVDTDGNRTAITTDLT